ncbi:hypothetical protein Tco_0314054, partial [Tanacetum coccineum]
MALHWSGVGAALLMSSRQDETSEPLSYAGWMDGPYRVEDAIRGRNDDPVTSGIRATSDRGGTKQNRSSCSPEKFLKVLVAQRWSAMVWSAVWGWFWCGMEFGVIKVCSSLEGYSGLVLAWQGNWYHK